MAKLISRKCRLCRTTGKKLFLKGERCLSPKCPITKKGAVPPGPSVSKRKKKISDYGIRLFESQKIKRSYGIGENQLKKYFQIARKIREATGEALLQLLESRLDNVVYRLGISPSRRMARQLVSHGHILVNGKKVTIASYRVKAGDVLSIDSKGQSMLTVKKSLENKEYKLPDWLQRKATIGKIDHLPKKDEIGTDVDLQLIVEFYSRR